MTKVLSDYEKINLLNSVVDCGGFTQTRVGYDDQSINILRSTLQICLFEPPESESVNFKGWLNELEVCMEKIDQIMGKTVPTTYSTIEIVSIDDFFSFLI